MNWVGGTRQLHIGYIGEAKDGSKHTSNRGTEEATVMSKTSSCVCACLSRFLQDECFSNDILISSVHVVEGPGTVK